MLGLGVLAGVLASLLTAGAAEARIIDFSVDMDCAQSSAGTGTCAAGATGTGTGTVSYDSDSHLLSWNVSWSGLSGDFFAAHFHGPATPNQDALVQQNMNGCCGGTGSIDSATLTPGQASDLLLERWYVNVHTTTFLSGEIRGHVVRVTGVPSLPGWGLVLLALALLALGRLSLGHSGASLGWRRSDS